MRELEGSWRERRGKRKMSWLRVMRDQSDSMEDWLRERKLTDRAGWQ